MIGESIAHYAITAKLGQGGMGEVWRATDTKLNRDVALKIIPELFSADAQRMARFTRESQLLASLNHPHIAAIYGVEESGGRRCLVLELVEGQDLLQRIQGGPIPMDEALEIARQIAEALEAAHEKGVVHRDLKPANVKLTSEGSVKVLDFGLAKALESEPGPSAGEPGQSLSPTLTQAATQAGMILGTAAYMSPEQAKGKAVDRRADIFSYGVVLYEMLARKQCFRGETVSETLASVIKDDPDWSLLPAGTPPAVVGLIRRCLEKDPRQRLRDIGEARIILAAVQRGDPGTSVLATLPGIVQPGLQDGSGQGPDTGVNGAVAGGPAGGAAEAPKRRRMRPLTWLILMAMVAAMAAAIGFEEGKKDAPPVPHRQFSIEHDGLSARFGRTPVISPDGRRLAYVAGERLWIRDLDGLKPREVPESEGAQAPFWSPDSAWLGWVSNGNLYKMPVGGGQPVVLTKIGERTVHAAAWGRDGVIYVTGSSTSIRAVSELGGEPQPILETEEGQTLDFHSISILPGDHGLLYTVHTAGGADTVEVLSDGGRKVVIHHPGERVENAVYDRRGYIVLGRSLRNDGVWAVPFSLADLEVTGDPVLLDPAGDWPSLSTEGTLLYVQGAASVASQIVLVDRQGKVQQVVGDPQDGIANPALSWDATRVLVSAGESGNRDIWMIDLERGIRTRMTYEETVEDAPAWLPGDVRFAYTSGKGDRNPAILVRPADGSGDALTLVADGLYPSFSRDGSDFAYSRYLSTTGFDIWRGTYLAGAGSTPEGTQEFLGGPGRQYDVQLSPDGTLLAYAERMGGREDIFLTEFPGGGGRWKVSSNAGYWPRWSRDGKELYFLEEGAAGYSLMAVSVERAQGLRLSTPRELFNDQSSPGLDLSSDDRSYDVHPDGRRFVLTQVPGGEGRSRTTLVISQNWTEEFGEGGR